MKDAGIKDWVLTGDKIETAVEIGVSAGLLDDTMEQKIIDEDDDQSLEKKLKTIKENIEKRNREVKEA